jgi:hypothetical protein
MGVGGSARHTGKPKGRRLIAIEFYAGALSRCVVDRNSAYGASLTPRLRNPTAKSDSRRFSYFRLRGKIAPSSSCCRSHNDDAVPICHIP